MNCDPFYILTNFLSLSLSLSFFDQGYEMACEVATQHLSSVADVVSFSKTNSEPLIEVVQSSLTSKMYVVQLQQKFNLFHTQSKY
jgi:hypothetical protein